MRSLWLSDRSWNSGNTIDQVDTTVTLVPVHGCLWRCLQPPCPQMVMHDPCCMMAAAANESDPSPQRKQHINASVYGGSGLTTVAFISRNLDYDDAPRVNSERGQFSAAMATDAPDSGDGRIYSHRVDAGRAALRRDQLVGAGLATPMKAERC